MALCEGQIQGGLLTAVGIVLDPVREVRLDVGEILQLERSRTQGIVAEVLDAYGGVDGVALLGGVAEAGIACLLIYHRQQLLGLAGGVAPELVVVAVAPVDGIEVIGTDLAIDQTQPLVPSLR